MKKLVVLILFMLMASLATAGMAPYVTMSQSVDIPLNTVITVEVRMGTTPLILFVGSVLEVTGGTLASGPTGAGSWSSVNLQSFAAPDDWGAGFDVGMSGTQNPGWVADDLVYSFTFIADVAGNYEVDAIGGSWGTGGWTADQTSANVDALLAFQAYNVLPEPMTMALLGLGGLFLRRKK